MVRQSSAKPMTIPSLDHMPTESTQLTPLCGTFYGQVPAFQYFTQIKADQARRNLFKAKILRREI
jgi:hypothetical protein